MPTTSQMLLDYSETLLQVLAELRGAYLDSVETREQAIELVAAQITDPTSVQMAFEEVGDYSAESHVALELLIKEGGEMAEAQLPVNLVASAKWGQPNLSEKCPGSRLKAPLNYSITTG